MVSAQEYTPLAGDTKEQEEDVLEECNVRRRAIKSWHRRLIPAAFFLSGVLLGVLATCATPAVVHAMQSRRLVNTEAKHPQAVNDTQQLDLPQGFDPSRLKFLDYPRSDDPVCGKDRHEAKANGCHYDILATRWYNDDCWNGEVYQEFMDEMEMETFYKDPDMKEIASHDHAVSGDWDLLWPVHSFHIMHCLYQFRRFHRAILEGRHIDDDVMSYGHTLHCTRMIMNWPREIMWGKNTTTIIDSRVSYCLPNALSSGL